MQVNIYEAKTRLSELVEQARQGVTVVIAKNGTPLAIAARPTGSVSPGETMNSAPASSASASWRSFVTVPAPTFFAVT